ncbi:MAG: hypothetical protein WBV78_05795, partial [Roseobacter sp.]
DRYRSAATLEPGRLKQSLRLTNASCAGSHIFSPWIRLATTSKLWQAFTLLLGDVLLGRLSRYKSNYCMS